MAHRLVNKLFGAATPLPAEVREPLAQLTKLAQERPELAEPAALLSDVLTALYREPSQETPPSISSERASAKLTGGIPLLRGERVAVDLQALHRRWQEVCAAMERRQKSGAARAVADSLRGKQLDGTEMIRELLAGRPENIHERASQLDLDAATVALVLRLALFPALTSLCNHLSPLRQSVRWTKGYCLICGSWPLLGEFRGLEQLRFLRCALCAAEWECPRLLCPFCEARDHQVLGYLHVEGEELACRAAVCECCRGYVKMLATLTPLSPAQLLVEDLATTHLDLVAAGRGYTNQP